MVFRIPYTVTIGARLKREVDEMGDLESPGGPPVPEAGGRGVFPKPSGCGGTARVVNPFIRKEERSANRGEKSGT